MKLKRTWVLGVGLSAFLCMAQSLCAQSYQGVHYSPMLTISPDVDASGNSTQSGMATQSAQGSQVRAGQISAEKPFTISASIREGYNDNIYTSHTDKKGSFNTSISPEIYYKLPMPDGDFSLRYTFNTIYYNDRPQDSWDFQHGFVAHYAHDFSPRLSIDLRESFNYDQTPQASSNSALIRRNGNGYTNSAGASATYTWTNRFSTTTSYNNSFNGYEDRTVNGVNEFVDNGVSQDFSYKLLPSTSLVLSYAFDHYDYSHIDRSYDHHSLSVGVDHSLLREWVVSGRVGGEYVEYSNKALSSTTNPYMTLRTSWNFLPRSSLGASYSLQSNVTDYSSYGSGYGHNVQFDISHGWTPRLSTEASILFAYTDYSSSQALTSGAGNQSEKTFSPSLKGVYTVTDYLSLEAGYIFSEILANDAAREYTQNQFFFGVRGTY